MVVTQMYTKQNGVLYDLSNQRNYSLLLQAHAREVQMRQVLALL